MEIKNKSAIKVVAALFILIFHFWLPLKQGSQFELFMMKTTYIGVDMFFFLTAYSLSNPKKNGYYTFLWNRIKLIYLPFIIFAGIAAYMNKWSATEYMKTISGVNLFLKGGGSYLWFIPAIMIVYIILHWYVKLKNKHKYIPVIVLALWFIIGFFVTKKTDYTAMFILWNRIPIILLGCSFKDIFKHKFKKHEVFIISFLLMLLGFSLMFNFGFKTKLNVPIKELYYVTAIPFAMGVILFLSELPGFRPVDYLSRITLDMYMVQMTFGYTLVNDILTRCNSKQKTNLYMIVTIIAISAISYMIRSIPKIIPKSKK